MSRMCDGSSPLHKFFRHDECGPWKIILKKILGLCHFMNHDMLAENFTNAYFKLCMKIVATSDGNLEHFGGGYKKKMQHMYTQLMQH